MRLLRALQEVHRGYRGYAIDVCAELFERTDEIGLLARELFVETHRLTLYHSDDYWEHHHLRDPPIDDPKLDAQLARLVNRVLDHPEETHLGVVDAWNLAFMCGARSEAARRVAVDRLVPDLIGKPSLRLLRILCHLRAEDPAVRTMYLETLATWPERHGGDCADLPCWSHHDEETLAAFARVAEQCDHASRLTQRLEFSGLLDASEHEVTREWFAAMEDAGDGSWARLREHGFRHVSMPGEGDSKIRSVNRLGLTGPEFIEAAILVLEGDWPFDVHAECAWALLAGSEPSAEQLARLARLHTPPAGNSGWRSLNLLTSEQSKIDPRRSRLDEVPRLRSMLYAGNCSWLPNILAVTPLIPRDEDYLLAAMERGKSWQRRDALELVRAFEFDTPRIRAAVAARSGDGDPRVAELAAAVGDESGW